MCFSNQDTKFQLANDNVAISFYQLGWGKKYPKTSLALHKKIPTKEGFLYKWQEDFYHIKSKKNTYLCIFQCLTAIFINTNGGSWNDDPLCTILVDCCIVTRLPDDFLGL